MAGEGERVRMWRLLLIISMLLGGGLTAPLATAQDAPEAQTDLAAMLVPPSELPEPGYQFARGGYLTPDDARYLLERRYPLDADALDSVFDSAGWRQGYTGTLVLLSDRAYLLSDPLVTVTTTIHELDDDDGATLAEALLTGTPPDGAEDRDAAVDGATTWRVVSSQDDSLVTVARSGRFLVEVETAGRRRTPAAAEHAAVVRETLDRVDAADSAGNPGLSQQLVPLADARLIPVSVATEYPLAHTWYRLIDGEVIPAAGELNPPASSDLGVALEEIAITRQTAELVSQNWVTAGIVVARFGSPADAEAFDGVLRDPLDFFPVSEEVANVDPATITGQVEAISGETRVGGRYSGFRITIVEGDTVAQLTIRAMGSTLIGQDGAEAWAERQRACLAGVPCEAIALDTLLATPDAASPVAQGVDDGVYRSPVAPWSVAFDPTTWQVDDAFAQGGYDYLYLRADSVDVTFETIVDHRGDPEQCILDELDRLREDEDRARISLGSDDPDEPPGGLNEGHGWIVYTVEPLEDARADQEYVIRIDCYTVVAGSTSLVVQARAPRDQWSRLAPVAGELRSRIEIEGVPMGRATGDLPGAAPTTRSDVMINRRPWVGNAA
jgi:hypothetical protein